MYAERPAGVLHHDLAQELISENGTATLRVPLPFADKGDLDAEEDRARGDRAGRRQKRTIMLPPAMAAYRPRGARFEDGALGILFEKRRTMSR